MILSQLLYILQSEHYDMPRFLRFAYTNLKWWKLSVRGKLDWTLRSKLIFALSVVLLMSLFVGLYLSADIFFFCIGCIATIFALPLLIVCANIMVLPLVWFQKKTILHKAKNLLEHSQSLVSLGITGSYGKTTVKNIIESMLSGKYTVMTIPGNINTDLGIANYLLSHRAEVENLDILLVEMGAYHPGDIASICSFVQPDYSFMTAIAPVHLERFGSLENIIKAKFELYEGTQKQTFLNISDENIKGNYERFSSQSMPECIDTESLDEIEFVPDFEGMNFMWKGETFSTRLIAKHIVSLCYLVLPLAKKLGMTTAEIQKGLSTLSHVPHRLQVIHNKQTGVTVLDDSYNGNFAGFCSGLKTLSRAKGRKIVLTPGIVELGSMQKEVHERLAQQYIDHEIDMVLLVENSNTRHIATYFTNNGFSNYKTYSRFDHAHADLANILKNGDTIIFQNDLPDNYR